LPDDLPNYQETDFEYVNICNKGIYLYDKICYEICPNRKFGSNRFCVEICEEFTEIDMVNRLCIHCKLENKYFFGGKCYDYKNLPQNTFFNDTNIEIIDDDDENEEIK
jgi:hypothetical protein